MKRIMYKKIVLVTLSLLMLSALTLSACGGKESSTANAGNNAATEADAASDKENVMTAPPEGTGTSDNSGDLDEPENIADASEVEGGTNATVDNGNSEDNKPAAPSNPLAGHYVLQNPMDEDIEMWYYGMTVQCRDDGSIDFGYYGDNIWASYSSIDLMGTYTSAYQYTPDVGNEYWGDVSFTVDGDSIVVHWEGSSISSVYVKETH